MPPQSLAARLTTALKAAGVPIVGVSIGDPAKKATWTVQPPQLQAAAQPTIDAFDPTDPAHEQAELTEIVTRALDGDRLTSAVVWTILRQVYPSETTAQTKARYAAARGLLITVFAQQPWKS